MKSIGITSKYIKCALATLAFVAAAPVLAQATASASLNQLTWQLVDDDLTDGVTPSLVFDDAWSIQLSANLPGSLPYQSATGNAFGTISAVDAYGIAHAGTGLDLVQSSATAYSNGAGSFAMNRHYFTLSANTSVTFFADGHLAVSDGGDIGSARAAANIYSYAGDFAGTLGENVISVGDIFNPNGPDQSFDIRASSSVFALDGPVRGWVDISTYTNVESLVPVPEPAAPAMLLGGLGLLAAIRRGRRQRAA
jgi:hypothetical protein